MSEKIGRPISIREALRLSNAIRERAERERREDAEREAKILAPWEDEGDA